mmetsp:Transcript_21438/g.63483  ORF Transcript_21438/g.63483 Transcript_21438/m.63483 type:complete len:147 (+) Transcript_21438:201-641(+)
MPQPLTLAAAAEAVGLVADLRGRRSVKVGRKPGLSLLGVGLRGRRGVVVVLHVKDGVLEEALGLCLLAQHLVCGGVHPRLLDHARDVLVGVARRGGGDGGRGLGAGRLVLGRDGEDAVRVDVHRDLDLRLAALGALDAGDGELAQL